MKLNVDIGGRVVIRNGSITINGKRIKHESLDGIDKIVIDNNIESIDTDLNVEVHGDVADNVKAGGNVSCDDVGESIEAGGNVSCDDVEAGGNVSCDDVGGNIKAGANVSVS